jgi:CHC2 zinc finger/AAA domain
MKIDIQELKKNANAVAIIGRRMTLKQQGDHYTGCCPIHGEKTPSFKLDKRQGEWLWKCFGCGKGGDVLRFIELADKVDVKKAIEILEKETVVPNKEWLKSAEKVAGELSDIGQDLRDTVKPKETIPLDKWIAGPVARLKTSTEGMAWLRDVRGLDDNVIEAMYFGYVQKHQFSIKDGMDAVRDKGWIMMPRVVDGKVVAVKLRSIVEKVFTQAPGMDGSALFNVEAINVMQPVYVTEGELDAAVMSMCGFCAISVPSAGAAITPENRTRLKLAERIYLAGDNDGVDEKGKDKAGVAYMKKLLLEMGEKTHRLIWPDGAKDANDYFRDACGRDKEQFASAVERLAYKARNAAPEGTESVLELLRQSDDTDMANDPTRIHWPLESLDNMAFTPAGDPIVLFSSYSGTGKTMLKTQLLLHEAKRGEVVVDLSPEIRGKDYIALLASQVLGPHVEGGLRRTAKITRDQYYQTANVLDKPTAQGTDFRYFVGHTINGGTEKEVLGWLEAIIQQTGATRIAVDTFHRLFGSGGSFSQTEAEGRMAKKLEELGKKYKCSFILICQSNAEAEGVENLKKDTLGTLRGSRELKDAVTHIYLLHRKRRPQKDGEDPDRTLELDATLFLQKDRFPGPGKPQVRLQLKEEWSTFLPSERETPLETMQEPASGENYDAGSTF